MAENCKAIFYLSRLLQSEQRIHLTNVTLCFGRFDVVHPGHLRYFRKAREYGMSLVVALEGDAEIQVSEESAFFQDKDRADAVITLDLVDAVVILDSGDLKELVRLIQPLSLVLGREFESQRFSVVAEAVHQANQQQVRVIFTAGETHYATAGFLYGSQHEHDRNRWLQFNSTLSSQQIYPRMLLKRFVEGSAPRILVLGDSIIDRYVACDPIGMSNEAPVVVVKELENRDFVGGGAIVAAHVAALGGDCTYISVVGRDSEAELINSELSNYGVTTQLIEDTSRPTTHKIRYMVDNQKLFRVSRLKDHSVPKTIEKKMVAQIWALAPSLDGILVCDFVYGIITPSVIENLQQVSQRYGVPLFGDLQCSSQIGNVSKFRNYMLLCPTEREARIAMDNRDDGIEVVANALMRKTNALNLVIKLGAQGLICYERRDQGDDIVRRHFPALSANPLDVAGAGDSLLATTSVALTKGLSLLEGVALGTCTAAIAVETIGNLPIHLEQIEEYLDKPR